VRLTWWDLDAKQLRTIDFPSRTFDVAPNPALASATVAPRGAKFTRNAWLILLCALVVAAGVLFLNRNSLIYAVAQIAVFFRPIHLQPLNPLPKSTRANGNRTTANPDPVH
jgi:hypothetical protein